MPNVYIIGFRGTGFRDTRYSRENTLIRAGHVGLSFEGEEDTILGFRPTQEASAALGDAEAVVEWLKEHNSLDGALHLDTAIFERAYELAKVGARTVVWQMVIPLSEEEFERVRTQALKWYTEKNVFSYAFPLYDEGVVAATNNCATFPRELGLPLPEPSGRLVKYIPAIRKSGHRWKPGKD